MKITREVIYDLLPAYFANEVSADTRALIEEYFATDAEFGRMAERFRALLEEKRRHPEPETDAAREREAFDRARLAAELPAKTRMAALMWAFAALVAWTVAFLTWRGPMARFYNPGVLLGTSFFAGALVTFVLSYYVKPESPWRVLIGVDDESLKSLGLKGRGSSSGPS